MLDRFDKYTLDNLKHADVSKLYMNLMGVCTPTRTLTSTPTPTPTPTATATATPTPSVTATATATPSATATATATSSATATATGSSTATPTATATGTSTATPTATATATVTGTSTATPTATATLTRTPTPSVLDLCRNIYEALEITIQASEDIEGHSCNDAEFDVYIKWFEESEKRGKNVWIFVDRVNFNNGRDNPGEAHAAVCDNGKYGYESSGCLITKTIILSQELVEIANKGKDFSNDRRVCCALDLTLIGSHFPNTQPYFSGEQNPTLPLELSSDVYLPPIGEQTWTLYPRTTTRVHENVTMTSIIRISDGYLIRPASLWYGADVLDVCQGLAPPSYD